MCVLCDIRYFLAMTDVMHYITAFGERENEMNWKITDMPKYSKRAEKVLNSFKDCPNISTGQFCIKKLVEELKQKYNDILLWLSCSKFHLIFDEEMEREAVDENWVEKIIGITEELNDYEKCLIITTILIRCINDFHEFFNKKMHELTEKRNREHCSHTDYIR